MKKKQKNSENIKKINSILEFPSGLLRGGIHIEMRSNEEAILDGRCAVLEYTEACVRINTGILTLYFSGKNLEIKNLSDTGLTVTGCICSVEFLN